MIKIINISITPPNFLMSLYSSSSLPLPIPFSNTQSTADLITITIVFILKNLCKWNHAVYTLVEGWGWLLSA